MYNLYYILSNDNKFITKVHIINASIDISHKYYIYTQLNHATATFLHLLFFGTLFIHHYTEPVQCIPLNYAIIDLYIRTLDMNVLFEHILKPSFCKITINHGAFGDKTFYIRKDDNDEFIQFIDKYKNINKQTNIRIDDIYELDYSTLNDCIISNVIMTDIILNDYQQIITDKPYFAFDIIMKNLLIHNKIKTYYCSNDSVSKI